MAADPGARWVRDIRHAEDLVLEWRVEADLLEARGLRESATVIRSLADDLEAVLGREKEESLSLKEAARESGYSSDHLGRLVRSGKIPNAGRPGAPRIRRGDLPRKTKDLSRSGQRPNFPMPKTAIVRSIADREE